MNSPWGLVWHIATQTGWTADYIMHGIAWINLRMMMADAPSVKSTNKSDGPTEEATDDDINALNE